jgi:P pilus assembly chaperone PapD
MMNRKNNAASLVFLFLLMHHLPAEASISISGSLTHEMTAQPGETYEGSFAINNSDDEPREVKIYKTDYLFSCDGKNEYGDPGKAPRSNADWISYSPRRLVIPAKDSSKVNYKVKVPDDEHAVGTYWSILMVEGISRESAESSMPAKDKPKIGIQTVMRYGIQVVTHIGDTGTSKMKFLDSRLIREDGEVFLQVDIENTGERWLKSALWVELYDERGASLGKFKGGKRRIYPGTSVRYKVPLTLASKGRYKALVVADCGGENVFGGVYTLNIVE